MGGGAWQAVVGVGMTTASDEIVASAESARGRVIVREARAEDIETVGRIETESFSDPWGPGEFKTVLDAPRAIFLVAADAASGVVSGYSIALSVLDESEILNIAVERGMRGRGLGALLLDGALAEVRERGATAVFLEVRESNEPARRLYASRGFAELSRRKKYYRNPAEDALVLRLAMQ